MQRNRSIYSTSLSERVFILYDNKKVKYDDILFLLNKFYYTLPSIN